MAMCRGMSLDCLRSAKVLLDAGLLRRSVSSSYYAAYCAVTSELAARGLSFAHGWNNPSHEQLPDFIANNMALPRNTGRQLVRILRRLRAARESADYRPGATVDGVLALASMRGANAVLFALGVEEWPRRQIRTPLAWQRRCVTTCMTFNPAG